MAFNRIHKEEAAHSLKLFNKTIQESQKAEKRLIKIVNETGQRKDLIDAF